MSVRIETLSAETVTVHRVECGEELVEDYEDTVVTGEVALALSYDEVVSIEGTEERVNTLAATMLASVPGGPYAPVARDLLDEWAEELATVTEANAYEVTTEIAAAIRATLQR